MNARTRVVIALGVSQTLAWGSTYYLPAILAVPMARDLDLSTGTVFAAFSSALVVPARFGQALAPLAFALLIERFGTQALLFSAALGLAGLGALFVLQTHAMKEAT
ncbi:hypothetical protein [Halomonas sp. C05BenzN]|uniref:hypothetical protein n=1 Tax=Halomonas sp. C05BenzN TaxID=3411041 RepID=UPI003B9341D4